MGGRRVLFLHPTAIGDHLQHQIIGELFVKAREALGYGEEITLETFGRHCWVTQRLDEGWTYTDISHYTLNDPKVLMDYYART